MSEIILSNQSLSTRCLLDMLGITEDQTQGPAAFIPGIVPPYTPYLLADDASGNGRGIMAQFASYPVAKELTNLSLSYGEETAMGLSEMFVQTYPALLGNSINVYGKRMGGFTGAVQNYQGALMDYHQAVKSGSVSSELAKQRALNSFQRIQRTFQLELQTATANVRARRGTPLTNPQRGLNIARSSRNIAKLNVTSQIEAANLVKLTKYTRYLGNGLAMIDFGKRASDVYNTHRVGGNWEREMFVESISFAASATSGIIAVNAGTAALGMILTAVPIVGWGILICGGVAVSGAAVCVSLSANSFTKENAGRWYDNIMKWIS